MQRPQPSEASSELGKPLTLASEFPRASQPGAHQASSCRVHDARTLSPGLRPPPSQAKPQVTSVPPDVLGYTRAARSLPCSEHKNRRKARTGQRRVHNKAASVSDECSRMPMISFFRERLLQQPPAPPAKAGSVPATSQSGAVTGAHINPGNQTFRHETLARQPDWFT